MFAIFEPENKETEVVDTSIIGMPTTNLLPSSFLRQLREKAANDNFQNDAEKPETAENIISRKLSKEALIKQIANINMQKPANDNVVEVKVENNSNQVSKDIINKTETTLITFKEISAEMIKELETFGVTDFAKIANLEANLIELKNTLNSLQTNQEKETSKITVLINLHQEIVNKFEEIKKLSELNEQAGKSSENTALALSDVKSEMQRLKEERDLAPGNVEEQKAKLDEQIRAKRIELKELHKDATSEERRNEVLKVITILEKIKKITNATEEVKELTSKLDPEQLRMFLANISLQGFMFTMTSKKKTKVKDQDEQDKIENRVEEVKIAA
jgi:hypothetical protein